MSEQPGTGVILPEPEIPTPRGGALAPAGDGTTIGLLPRAVQLARMIAGTDFVKRGLRDNVPAITAAILAGDELGLRPMASLAYIDIIEGQPALRAVAMRALIQSHGHEIWFPESTSTRCTIAGRRRGSDRTTAVTWTKEDAERAKLLHKGAWVTYPRAMLVARATGELARMIFSDVVAGIPYVQEEMADDLAGVRDVVDGTVVPPAASGEELPPETPSTSTRQAPGRRRRSYAQSSGDAQADQSHVALDAAPAGPGEVTAAAPPEAAASGGHAPTTASLGRRGGTAPERPAPSSADTWAGLEVPGDEPVSTSEPDADDETGPGSATPPAAQPSTGSPEPPPGAVEPPAATGGTTMEPAQQVAMWARDAGVDRADLCSAASGGRVTSARALKESEAAVALDMARAIARGEKRLTQAPDGRWVVTFRDRVEILTETVDLLIRMQGADRRATREMLVRHGWPAGRNVKPWVDSLAQGPLIELLVELRSAVAAR